MSREYLPFIDWMKALGIALIVFGHVAAAPINHLVPPIYPKQLGVAFFIFVIGFSLSREKRPAWQVLFNRLFEVYLFGVAIALLMSAVTYASRGTLALSNYLPFFFGANVVVNNFPANPTTWYIGTYIHVLVLWTLVVRRFRIPGWVLAVSVVLEIAIRSALLLTAGEYIAYMLFPNWMTVFLLGVWFGQRGTPAKAAVDAASDRVGLVLYSLLFAAFAVGWAFVVRPHMLDYSFPFMRLSSLGTGPDAIVTAAAVSVVYVCYTLLVFQVARRVMAPSPVRFVARNTLIVFIGHMPAFYQLNPVLKSLAISYATSSIIQILVCLLALAFVSEAVHRAFHVQELRTRLARRFRDRDHAIVPSM